MDTGALGVVVRRRRLRRPPLTGPWFGLTPLHHLSLIVLAALGIGDQRPHGGRRAARLAFLILGGLADPMHLIAFVVVLLAAERWYSGAEQGLRPRTRRETRLLVSAGRWFLAAVHVVVDFFPSTGPLGPTEAALEFREDGAEVLSLSGAPLARSEAGDGLKALDRGGRGARLSSGRHAAPARRARAVGRGRGRGVAEAASRPPRATTAPPTSTG